MRAIPLRFTLAFLAALCLPLVFVWQSIAADLRGPWVGNAQGTIFGAKGSVNITRQTGEDIFGIVEGSNFLGSARFTINGRVRGNHIFGSREGHTFEGFLYPDGSIRGLFRASDGDTYSVFLQRPYQYWGVPPGMMYPY